MQLSLSLSLFLVFFFFSFFFFPFLLFLEKGTSSEITEQSSSSSSSSFFMCSDCAYHQVCRVVDNQHDFLLRWRRARGCCYQFYSFRPKSAACCEYLPPQGV
eukprot:TRINITY_DN15742_c0_g1_i1.p1 TRINITY_DN15742_c0_g1~~TRINITY_DN15742_c0_g1_i1.p1  ORF type:complete len:102 (+),score=4.15 TRINITY_DN15742_c0_g1_i1:92-397(+)